MADVMDPPITDPVTDPVTAAVSGWVPSLDALMSVADAGSWRSTGEQLLEAIASLHEASCRLDAVIHRLVREVDARGAATAAGAASTAGWLRGRLRMHPGAATRLVETSRALHDDPAGPLVPHESPAAPGDHQHDEPAGGCRPRSGLRAAFAAGLVNGEHAREVCATLDKIAALPGGVDARTAQACENFLLEQSLQHDPKALHHLGRHLLHTVDPRAGEVLERAEQHAQESQRLELRQRKDGSTDVSGRLGPETSAALRAHLSPLSAPRPAVDGVKDSRDLPRRQADALGELLTRYARAQAGPTVHGASTTLTVTMSLDTLARRAGSAAAWLDWSGPVSAATARRLACDARVVPVVLGSRGEPLDVGRASYEVTQPIWRALVARDGGCAFAGCDRPPEWTQAHHRVHWEDGGETSVANCALLCDHHHRAVHHHGWDVVLRDGVIWTLPPPWIDPARTPRRNTQRSRLLDPHSMPRIPPD